LSSIYVLPDPVGVKKWGIWPPSSYGCAAPGIWGAETPKPIATKFCMPGAVQD